MGTVSPVGVKAGGCLGAAAVGVGFGCTAGHQTSILNFVQANRVQHKINDHTHFHQSGTVQASVKLHSSAASLPPPPAPPSPTPCSTGWDSQVSSRPHSHDEAPSSPE